MLTKKKSRQQSSYRTKNTEQIEIVLEIGTKIGFLMAKKLMSRYCGAIVHILEVTVVGKLFAHFTLSLNLSFFVIKTELLLSSV